MRRPVQTLLPALTGAGLLHIALFTDTYLRYVKAGLRPLLLASGAVLLLLGLAAALSRGTGEGHHGHDHSGPPRIAWLLLLPALSLLLWAPPALGAYTAARSAAQPLAARAKGFPPLPATSPLPLTLTEFTKRVQQDASGAIRGRTVRLTGFVTPAPAGDGWYLTRIIFTCCAADSQTVKVRVHGTPPAPADTWLAVTGIWHPGGTLGTRTAPAELDVRGSTPIAPPVNAYTDDLPVTPG
ncbi:TIGR03943 family protein [Streptomyces misionensis]|uniref:TIGR03943 family protein n=1 Tax=Streptomyces misionensis TaxID=67331 RepID=A0A5C6K120_9ACTN|nr:TIGR03943 family protein [Streptomyces misionensis]TWV56750.1 TIGR03943 family protein [Streptomyces misionensis]